MLAGMTEQMRQFARFGRFIPAVIAAALLMVSCGHKAQVTPEQHSPFPSGLYETVWVNPQMVFSDSLVTLIRAERIDSLPAEPSGFDYQAPSILAFTFQDPLCTVTINLVDENLNVVYPLLLRKLPAGFYKLTFNPLAIKKPGLPPGVYFLQAEYCGRVENALFTVD